MLSNPATERPEMKSLREEEKRALNAKQGGITGFLSKIVPETEVRD